jgi:chemotaxis protein MotB
VADPEQHEIVIIRRRPASDADTVKGGVWKIAFADFMTAMMAFFLVMWLINAASEETKQAVASYFNPVKLANLNTKGLQDPQVVTSGPSEHPSDAESEETPEAAAETEPHYSEDALFRDPYSVLSEILDGAEGGAQAPGTPQGDERPSGLKGGEAFRDPFDPASWQNPPGLQAAPAEPAEAGVADPTEAVATSPAQTEPVESATDATPPTAVPAPAAPPDAGAAEPATFPPPAAETADEPSPDEPDQPAAAAEPSEAPASELQEALAGALRDGSESARAPLIEVQRTGEGVLISLTDDLHFGMFAVGSAEPHPEVIRIMAKIADVLKTRPGQIIVRGHTDARPFRSENYDNWRLSSARAHMAYYMLVRGGLEERRVDSIEGHADRRLKLPSDPEAAENRRIEILVKEDAL